jgi:NarL family two-component system sensor histidine kinase LiaS
MSKGISVNQGVRGLRWKLTISYMAVTVGTLITIEIILLAAASVGMVVLVNNGTLPNEIIKTASTNLTPLLRIYLSQTPPDVDGLRAWLDQAESISISIPLSFDATDSIFVVGPDSSLLTAKPDNIFGAGQIGQPLDMQLVPGLAEPLQAALAGEDNPAKLYSLGQPGEPVVLAIPIWNADHQQVLGVLVGLAEYPTLPSVLGEALPVVGASLLILTLIAGVTGALYGYLAARGPVRRLKRLSEAAYAWRQGDFTEFVKDAESDELGQLAQQLNHMAQELEQLLETRRALAVAGERNRLASELHDSAKQQAFAAAAQISGVRTLIHQDPATAETHLIEAENIIDQLRRELTGLIFELRPEALDDRGLAPSLEAYTAEWSRQNRIEAKIFIKNERPLPLEIEQTLFRIVQEALANAARHSQAESVDVILRYHHTHLTLTVSDDGQGFDLRRQTDGFGLQSMKGRAESLGGQFTVDSVPGGGTALTCNLPIPTPNGNDQEETHG